MCRGTAGDGGRSNDLTALDSLSTMEAAGEDIRSVTVQEYEAFLCEIVQACATAVTAVALEAAKEMFERCGQEFHNSIHQERIVSSVEAAIRAALATTAGGFNHPASSGSVTFSMQELMIAARNAAAAAAEAAKTEIAAAEEAAKTTLLAAAPQQDVQGKEPSDKKSTGER